MAIDFSQYGAVPIQEDPAGSKSKIDYSAYGAQPVQEQQPQMAPGSSQQLAPERSTLDKLANNPLADATVAYGSKMRQGVTDILGDVGGFTTELLQRSGAISVKQEQAINRTGLQAVNAMDTADRQMFGKEVAENPGAASVGRAVGNLYGMVAAGSLGGESTAGQMVAQGALGGAMAGKGNRAAGIAGGLLLPIAATQIGASVGNFVLSNAKLPTDVVNTVKAVNSAGLKYGNKDIFVAVQDEFDKFKAGQGEIDVMGPSLQVTNILKNYRERLTPQQIGLLEDVQQRLASAKNLVELHDARKLLTENFDGTFFNKSTSIQGDAKIAVMGFKKNLESNLQKNAENLGVLDHYTEANRLFKQSLDAKKLNDALYATNTPDGGVSWNKFNAYLLRPKIAKSLQPETKQAIEGLRKTFYEANHILGVNLKDQLMLQSVTRSVVAMTQAPVLNQILRVIGTESGKAMATKVAQALVNKAQAEYIKNAYSFSNAQEQQNAPQDDPSLDIQNPQETPPPNATTGLRN